MQQGPGHRRARPDDVSDDRPGLPSGLTGEVSFEITEAMVPGHVAGPVLSTPSLVSLIERACRRGVLEFLEAGRDTVGTHICISHEGVVLAGEEIRVAWLLRESDGQRLTFDVAVDGPRGVVSRGSHQRRIVDPSRFGRVDGHTSTQQRAR
jgi:fluoroacetyl-CoA thioesterase